MLISGDCAGQLKQFMPFRAMYSWVDLGLVRLTGALSSWKKISTPREISSYHWTQVLFHNVLILFSINVSIYRCNRSNTIPRNTTQYHYFVPGLRYPGSNKVWSPAFVSLAPDILWTRWSCPIIILLSSENITLFQLFWTVQRLFPRKSLSTVNLLHYEFLFTCTPVYVNDAE